MNLERLELPAPNVANWERLYQPDAKAVCVKDNPPMRGFGRQLKVGDVVDVRSICWDGQYTIAVQKECATYHLDGYFEVQS